MNKFKAFAIALTATAAFGTTAHAAQDDLFVLGNGVNSQKISYDSARQVKICVSDDKASSALKVEHGLGTNVIEPGSCYSFETSEFRVSARSIKRNYQLTGYVQSAN